MVESLFALPSGAFRFELGLRRGDAAFFRNAESDAPLLAERAHWLASDPGRYAAAAPGSEPLLAEAITFARSANAGLAVAEPEAAALGRAWPPDFLLLSPDAAGAIVLRAGCVCFPSHWDLGEKLGRPLAEIHAPVPTLNGSLARQIDGFLSALRPGAVWERWNWGLAATSERNDHPARRLPRLGPATPIEEIWLRAEHQVFVRLPVTGAVLFAIRLVIEPLRDALREPAVALRLAELLETMPDAVAEYKGVAPVRAALIEKLRSGA